MSTKIPNPSIDNNNNNNNNNNNRGNWNTIRKSLAKYLSNIRRKHEIKELEKRAILGPAHSWKCGCKSKGKGKAIPLQPWTGPEGSSRLRLPDFKTIGT